MVLNSLCAVGGVVTGLWSLPIGIQGRQRTSRLPRTTGGLVLIVDALVMFE